MAKIALITEHITPQVLGLAQALQFHRHEIMLITSYDEEVPENINYQVLRFFKTWSAFEAIRFFPRLLGQAPDVWHFVFSSPDHKPALPKTAQYILAQLAKALPRRVLAASFYDSLFEIPGRKVAPMMKIVDIVTTATREQLMFIKRKSWLKNFSETEVLPPFVVTAATLADASLDQDLSRLLNSMSPYLLIPNERINQNLQDDALLLAFLKQKKLIVCGSRPMMKIKQLGLQSSHPEIAFVGRQILDSDMHSLLKNSQGLLIAFDDFSAIELLHFHHLCQQTKTPILANPRQAEALPGLCLHGKNGFILDQGLRSLNLLLAENPNLATVADDYHLLTTDLADSALNELNRLYSKVQHLKTSQKDPSIDIKSSPLS